MFRWKAVLAGLILISGWEVCLGQTPGTIFTVAGIGVGDGLTATAVQLVSPVGVAVDGQGNLYIADSGHSHVRKVDTFGIISTVAGNGTTGFSGDGGPATEAQLSNFEGIAVDGQGNLYIADWGNGRIRKVDSEGIISTVVGGGTGDSSGDGEPALGAQLLSPSGVAVDAQGNIYITEYEGHRIRKVDSAGIISTVAGNGTAGFSGDGGPATEAQLGNPEWVAVDGQGNLFIADAGNRRLRKVDSAGIISTVAGSGTEGFSGDGGPATAAQLSYPEWVAVDAQGSLFIADRDNHRLRKVDNAGIISTVAGNGTPGFSGDGGPATAAQLNGPFAVAVGVQGNLFLADAGNHRIRKVDNAGIISTVAGGSVGDGLPATEAQLFLPLVVSVDGQGNFYIADFANHRIRKVDSAGIISTVAGNGTGGFSGDGRTATEVQLNLPSGVSVDGQGNLFIADRDNHRIRKVDPFGIISTVVGNGTSGFSGDGGEATQAQLNAPVEVVVDAQGNLFIADRGNHRIRKVSSWGTISTVAGEGTAGFSGDGGLATEAQLSLPSGVAVDGQGNLFIADLDNHRIRKVDSTGIISTVAGEGTADFSGDGGPATAAQLSGPAGVAVDGYGNLYIADRDNHRTRKVDTFGIISTVAGNGTAGFSGDGGPATAAQLSGPAGVTMDYLGNLFIADEANHRIRKVVSPALLAHSLPLPGAPLYPDSRITVVFDWPVDFSSVSTTTFVVEGSASGPISGTVTHDPASNSATFFPGAALQVGETVRVRLSGVVLDGDGDGDGDGPPVGELSWTFPVEASLVMTAYPVVAPPGLDGRLEAGEYAAAVPVYVELSSPYTLPGIVPVYPLPESAADLSFTAYLVYTATDLYVAVEVADEAIIDDPEQSWEDDDVELFFDGDRVSNDLAVGNANAEGGHFWVDAGGVDAGGEGLERGVAWFSAVNTRTGGWVAEFRIPLASLDTEDGPGVRAPGAGDTMGFNITVGDDDNGGAPYEFPWDSYGAWSGLYGQWFYARESDWGRLHLSASPAPPLVVVSPNGSEEWGGGTAHQIRWVAEPGIENVRIEYSTDDGSTWTSIISSAPNTGSYAWAVPEEVSPVARVRISDAADGEPVDVSDWPSVIRPYLAPLVNWVSHHRPTVFPQELLTITAQVSPTEAPVSQVGALIYRDESPVVEVVLEDDGVAPDEVAGDQIYSGQWSTAQVGGYRINLLAEDREGIQGVREYADFFAVAHTILSFPDNMMISPEGLSGVRIPLLLEDDGSGRLNQGFLSAQFGIQMQGNSMIPSQIDTSFEGTRLEGQSFSSAVNAFPGGRLEVALANAAPLHLAPTPGPAQQVLTYVDTDLELVNPGGYFYLYVTRALFDEDADSVSISCCGGVTLGRGDVDLSGGIESFDASLALMHSVYNIDLNWAGNPLNDPVESQYGFTVPNLAWLQADVTGQLGVTAFDAALILRHEVGLITHFPAEEGYYRLWDPPPGWWNPPAPAAPKPVAAATAPLHKVVHAGPVEEEEEEVVVPVEIDGMEGILAGSFVLRYQPERLQVVEVRKGPLTADYILMHHVGGDAVRVAFAGAQWPQGGGRLAEVVFRRQRGRGVELGPLALSEVQLNEGEVQVEVEESLSRSVSHLPQALALQPNYPNPFNPSTAIRYEMPAGAPVEVSIYNLVGQRIRIMWKGWQEGGYHQVVWDGRDEAGKEVSTGIYLCRLETGGHTLVRKMLLVK